MNEKIGINYPISKGNVGFFNQTFETLDNIKSNILVLFNTISGERPLNSNFGLNLHKYLFEQLTLELKEEIIDEIKNKINIYIPEIETTKLDVDFIDANSSNTISRNIIKIDLNFLFNNETGTVKVEI